MPTRTEGKRDVRYFVSYAHGDQALALKLLTQLKKQFGASKDYDFALWRDDQILLGENWHTEIQDAIEACDFGLLLVSPAFLSSRYIDQHELPQFLSGQKTCMPVALCRIDFSSHDLKGLEKLQLFRYQSEGAAEPRVFEDHTSLKLQSDFALALFRQIKARLDKLNAGSTHDPKSPVPHTSIPHNLPTLQPFFGREDELKKIADALDPESRGWGALIDGPGGMGKTSLAVRAAYDASPEVFKQILFVSLKTRELDDDGVRDLSGFILSGLLELFNEMARELRRDEIVKTPEDQRARLLLSALRDTQTLLILDNLESLTKPDRDQLFTFIKKLPQGCKAILTSRGRIGSGAEELILEKLGQEAALETLADLATHNPLLKSTSEAERVALYTQTGGKPLLLRWTAGQLGRGSCRTFTDALEFLRSCPEGNDPLQFIFGDLAEGFTPAETRVLSALSYFTLPASVEHVAPIARLPEGGTAVALRSLTNRSLVVPSEELKTFALVPLVADFLRKQKPDVISETGDRLEHHALSLISGSGFDQHKRFPALQAAWPTLAAAMPRFLLGPNDLLQATCSALATFLDYSGHWDEWLVLNHHAERKAVEEGDEDNAGWRAYQAGCVHHLRGQADSVLACADRAAAHWSALGGHKREKAIALQLRGLGYQLKDDYPAAMAAYWEVLKIDRALSATSSDVVIDLNSLGKVEFYLGLVAESEEHFQEALKISNELDFVEGKANSMSSLATIELKGENWPGAEALARNSLAFSQELGRQQLIAIANINLVRALLGQGRAIEGLPHAQLAVQILNQLGSPDLEAARATLRECEEAAGGSD